MVAITLMLSKTCNVQWITNLIELLQENGTFSRNNKGCILPGRKIKWRYKMMLAVYVQNETAALKY